MSVSSLKFFSDVNLGPYEETLRLALCNDDPFEPESYPCILTAVTLGGELLTGWITKPSKARYNGHYVYWLVLSGVLHTFFVCSNLTTPCFEPFLLNKRNELVLGIDESLNMPFLRDTLFGLNKAIAERKKERL